MFGLLRPRLGHDPRRGRRRAARTPRQAIAAGVGFVPADRKLQGLVLEMTVRENLVMSSTARLARLRVPTARRRPPIVRNAFERTCRSGRARHACPSRRCRAATSRRSSSASGWRPSPACSCSTSRPAGSTSARRARSTGCCSRRPKPVSGSVVSSSETPELLTLCDRIVVMFRGRVAAELSREEASRGADRSLRGRAPVSVDAPVRDRERQRILDHAAGVWSATSRATPSCWCC